jgi:two-component system cell cycle response regulator DivK
MRRILESMGHVVVDVQDGADVLDMATGLLPDLIILDVRLPNVDGWQILATLMNADMVIRLLESINLKVRHVLRGLEGARMARQERPDLILMDFNLPDIDGRTLVLQLKKQLGSHAAPPIVAITARTGEREECIAQQFGCVAFVSKPFVPEEFLQLIKSLLKVPDNQPTDVSSNRPANE